MSHVTPCQDPANDPNDWFIERDGKQYPDDEILTDEDFLRVVHEQYPDEREVDIAEAHEIIGADDDLVEQVNRAEVEAVKDSLTRRRHAKDKCHTDCYFRLQCLDIAMSEPTPATHGTWGGYYSEELKQIRSARDEKRRRRR